VINETHNPYSPPGASIKPSQELNPSAIGLMIGFWFASPLILAVIASLIRVAAADSPNKNGTLIMFVLLVIILLTLGFGWWFGSVSSRTRFKATLLLALMQGTFLLLAFMSLMTVGMWWSEGAPLDFSYRDIQPTFIAWIVCNAWTVALGLVTRWRIRKLSRAIDDPDHVSLKRIP